MPVSAAVLVHSPLVGPLTWRAVAADLEGAGVATVVPSLSGATSHEAMKAAVLADVRRATLADGPIVLVGHSGAGALLPAVAEILADTVTPVEALVFVDARLPRPGRSWFADASAERAEHLRELAGEGDALPPWHDWFGPDALARLLPDAGLRQRFTDEVPRLPLAYFNEPAPTAQWRGPIAYLLLSEAYRDEAERLRYAGVPVIIEITDHLAMLSRPATVARALMDLFDRLSQRGAREQRILFGEVAETYDDVRSGYPAALYDAVLAHAGSPATAVEVGAGAGKATADLIARGLSLTCVEPDPRMAAFLTRHVSPVPEVFVGRFEDWHPPPGGVPLLLCTQSWHWLDPATRCWQTHAALRPGGTLALFGHTHAFADPEIESAINRAYDELAPELRHDPGQPAVSELYTGELRASGLFADIQSELYVEELPYPARRYVRLMETFSSHRMLAAERRSRLHERIADIVDEHGGSLTVRLDATLILARRA